jgi:hypothetical protein
MTNNRTILITGVTGNQGGAVAQALQGTGFSLRGLTRTPDSPRAAALASQGIDIVKGDLDDEATLRSALAGAWGVFGERMSWLSLTSEVPKTMTSFSPDSELVKFGMCRVASTPSGAHGTAYGRRPRQRGASGNSGLNHGGNLRREGGSLPQLEIGKSVDTFEDGGQTASRFIDHEHKVVHTFRRTRDEPDKDRQTVTGHHFV